MWAASETGDPVIGGLLFVGLVVLFLIAYARDRRRAPNVPCRRCGGRGVRSWVRSDASGPCPRCNGRPRQRRL